MTAAAGVILRAGNLPTGRKATDVRNALRSAVPLALALTLVSPSSSRAWDVLGAPLCTQPGIQRMPTAFGMGDGGMVVAWEDHRGSDFNLYLQRLDGNGDTHFAFPADGKPLCDASGDQMFLDMIEVPGGFAATWTDERSGSANIYALRVGWDGNPAFGWSAGGVPVSTAPGSQVSRIIQCAGDLFVIWNASGNNFVDSWRMTNGLTVNPGGATSGIPLIAGSAVGVVIDPDDPSAAFVLFTNSGLRVMRVVAAAQGFQPDPAWPAGGVVMTPLVEPGEPRIASNAAGGATVSWIASDGIHVQRLLATGSIAANWPAGGVVFSADVGQPVHQQIQCDTGGNVVVAWIAQPALSPWTMRMSKLTPGGVVATGWSASGLMIREGPALTPDFSLALVCGSTPAISWFEWPGPGPSGYDVRAQRVSPGGSIDWTPGGVLVTSAGGNQISPTITGTGPCGQVAIAWCDDRDQADDFDIYGAKILNDGGIVAAGENLPGRATFSVRVTGENPCRGPMSCVLTLGTAQRITADVLDVAGRRVRTIADAEWRVAGTSRLAWDGRDTHGRTARSGLYLVRVRSDGATTHARFIVTR